MWTGMRARMATMLMWMGNMKQQKPMMDEHRMWRTEA
jgi:hypothetical protein